MRKSQQFNEYGIWWWTCLWCNDKYIKTKIKVYGDKLNANSHGKTIPKEKTACKYLSLIMLDFVIRINKKISSSNTFGRMQVWNKKD